MKKILAKDWGKTLIERHPGMFIADEHQWGVGDGLSVDHPKVNHYFWSSTVPARVVRYDMIPKEEIFRSCTDPDWYLDFLPFNMKNTEHCKTYKEFEKYSLAIHKWFMDNIKEQTQLEYNERIKSALNNID